MKFLEETFTNADTGEDVVGITVLIDGELKQIMDYLLSRHPEYENDYSELVKWALVDGINEMVAKRNGRI